MAAIALTLTFPLLAHDGPEPHPTVAELEEAVAELREEISDLERRINSRMESLDALVTELDENTITNIVQSKVDEARAGTVHSFKEVQHNLIDRIDAKSNLALIFGSVGVLSGVIALARTIVKRSKRHRSDQANQVYDGEKESVQNPSEEDEQDDEDEGEIRRVVTATKKDPSTGKVLALQNSDAEWSPRSEEEVIFDIEDCGIEYVSCGPMGNEAVVEVLHLKRGKPYLRTKADKHGGNNLRELPEPT